MRSRKIEKAEEKKPIVTNERKLRDPNLRTIIYVEVGNSPAADVQRLLNELKAQAAHQLDAGLHYFVPIRHNKITSDVLIEAEWLTVVHETCEIVDGQIRLKGGAKDVPIIREAIT